MKSRNTRYPDHRKASDEALITIETLAAAAKHVEVRGKDRRNRVTIVDCDSASQPDGEEFISELAFA